MTEPNETLRCDMCGRRLQEDWEVENGLCEGCYDGEDEDDTTWDNEEAEEYAAEQIDDVCPFCQGPMTPDMAAFGMCDACAHEQDGGEW